MDPQKVAELEAWSTLAGTIIATVGLAVVWYQLRKHRKERAADNRKQLAELEADHDRRRMQATIEMANGLRSQWRQSKMAIRAAIGEGKITEEKLETINASEDLRERVHDLLSNVEHFAAGANAEVFDTKLIDRMCGGYMMGIADDFELVIRESRRAHATAYTELTTMVRELHKLREAGPGPKVKRISDGWPRHE